MLKRLLPAAQWRQYVQALEQQATAPFVPRVGDEQVDMKASAVQMRRARAARPLSPGLPLYVLTAGRATAPPGIPPRIADAWKKLWRELQDDLAALVPDARHTIATRSGHEIPEQQPALVIAAIGRVVDAVRDPRSWRR
jgi:hypothetical protein